MNSRLLLLFKKILLLGMGIIFLVVTLFFLSQKIRPVGPNEYMLSLLDKHEMLKEESKNGRIIFIGGSNLVYGLDSEKIEKAFNKKVINTAITAGLGLRFIFNDVKDYIKPKDIIVISPEYEYFFDDKFEGNEPLAYLIFYIYPEALTKIDNRQLAQIIRYLPSLAFKRIESGIGKILTNNTVIYNSFFVRSNFNKYGDMIGHLELPNEAIAVEDTGVRKFNTESVEFINDFVNMQQKDNVKFALIYPPFMDKAYADLGQQQEINFLDKYFTSNLKLPILSNPERYVLEEKYFFNGVYHLNKEGRELRTNMVIEDLKKVIKP